MEGETEERESMGDGLPFPLGLVELFPWVGGFCLLLLYTAQEFGRISRREGLCVCNLWGLVASVNLANLPIFFARLWWVRRSCLCEADGSNSEPYKRARELGPVNKQYLNKF